MNVTTAVRLAIAGLERAPPALRDVFKERARQVGVEGFRAEHDDNYRRGELVRAAIAYLYSAIDVGAMYSEHWWPWAPASFKPKDRRRDLVRAAALLLAEIERLDRAQPEQSESG